nr:MAG TPA: hypothetical protein [Caudoviricetes sp.]
MDYQSKNLLHNYQNHQHSYSALLKHTKYYLINNNFLIYHYFQDQGRVHLQDINLNHPRLNKCRLQSNISNQTYHAFYQLNPQASYTNHKPYNYNY